MAGIKKYVKVIVGVYVLFTIISPVVVAISGDKVDISNILDSSEYTEKLEKGNNTVAKKLESNNSRTIKDIYIENLSNDIKSRLKQKGYIAENIYISAKDDDEYTITKVEISIRNNSTNSEIHINEVNIGKTVDVIEEQENILETEGIKQYLADTYSMDKEIITIK